MPKSKEIHLGQKLADAIELKGISQAEVARHFDVKQPTVSSDWIKHGRIAKEHIPNLVKYFGLPYEWWFERGAITPARQAVARYTVIPDTPSSAHGIDIPRLNIKASAGNGVMQMDEEYQVGTISVPELWVRKNIVCTSIKNLRIITILGDSMQETLDDGDVAFVDIGVRQVDRDGIYVAELDKEIYIKRFERRPMEQAVWMRSDNIKKHPDPHIITRDTLKSLKILARAVFALNGRKL
jgi:transcriptional regulator with XRE-family HTH domain